MYPQMSFTKRVKAVVLEDESKEAESEKDGQKTEVCRANIPGRAYGIRALRFSSFQSEPSVIPTSI